MTAEPRVWVLNLDAEHELEAGKRYAPTDHLRAIVREQRKALLGTLVAPGDLVADECADGSLEVERLAFDEHDRLRLVACSPDEARGLAGEAWSPTPRALRILERVGAVATARPDVAVLRAVNARPLAARVRAPLAEGSFAKHVALDLDAALARLAEPAPDGWLVRRTFGAAGRGRRRIAPGSPTDAERAWLVASLRRGPLVVEPWVHVTRETTRSGRVTASGDVVALAPCFQTTTREGAWITSESAPPADVAADDARLAEAFEAAGRALAAAGYAGPFGVDAFRHRVPGSTREVLNPLSEINARHTMDGLVTRPAATSR